MRARNKRVKLREIAQTHSDGFEDEEAKKHKTISSKLRRGREGILLQCFQEGVLLCSKTTGFQNRVNASQML